MQVIGLFLYKFIFISLSLYFSISLLYYILDKQQYNIYHYFVKQKHYLKCIQFQILYQFQNIYHILNFHQI